MGSQVLKRLLIVCFLSAQLLYFGLKHIYLLQDLGLGLDGSVRQSFKLFQFRLSLLQEDLPGALPIAGIHVLVAPLRGVLEPLHVR